MASRRDQMCALVAALLLATAHAWHDGSAGRVSWDLGCDFHGHDLINQQAASEHCGGICTIVDGCTHWTWTAYLGGTCWLKQGREGQAYASTVSNCGFVKDKFTVDEVNGVDFDTGALRKSSNDDGLSAEDAASMLQVLNFYRVAYNKPRLALDARLVLAANEMVKACPPSLPPATNTELHQEPSAERFGFHDQVFALLSTRASNTSIAEALSTWGNVSDAVSTPLLNANTTIVGFARRSNTNCKLQAATTEQASTDVWTVLLA
ncbi:hypothetical protein FI667_g14715, partial [Globisporangium splendens]